MIEYAAHIASQQSCMQSTLRPARRSPPRPCLLPSSTDRCVSAGVGAGPSGGRSVYRSRAPDSCAAGPAAAGRDTRAGAVPAWPASGTGAAPDTPDTAPPHRLPDRTRTRGGQGGHTGHRSSAPAAGQDTNTGMSGRDTPDTAPPHRLSDRTRTQGCLGGTHRTPLLRTGCRTGHGHRQVRKDTPDTAPPHRLSDRTRIQGGQGGHTGHLSSAPSVGQDTDTGRSGRTHRAPLLRTGCRTGQDRTRTQEVSGPMVLMTPPGEYTLNF